MGSYQKISGNGQLIITIFVIVLIAICFDSAQQLYYIKRFDLAEPPPFLELFKYQTFKWVVWLIFSYLLILYTKRRSFSSGGIADFYKYALLIVVLVVVDIMVISIIQMLIVKGSFSLTDLTNEYLPFYTFQKAPSFTLGYISVCIIFRFYYAYQHLKIEVLQLEQLRKVNADLYKKLRKTFNKETSFLNIKIGNRQKIIPIDDILWVEADDYCSKIHALNNSAYVMRISLKDLEQKLDARFLRVHRGAIVNMKMVEEFQSNGNNKLVLKNQAEVVVSKSKFKMVKEFLSN